MPTNNCVSVGNVYQNPSNMGNMYPTVQKLNSVPIVNWK
jgi:hypothetical protein